MLPNKAVKSSLTWVPGKHLQEPNIVIVPAGSKTFSVGVEWSMEAEQSFVIGSHEPESGNRWCVLDGELKQVMYGSVGSARKGPKKAEAVVSRTIQGGGAGNPHQHNIEMSGAKLKNGASYTLVATHHGVVAAGEFVAVHQPKPKPAKKKAAAKKKAGRKKAAKKK